MPVQVRSYFIEHAVGADALPSRMALNYLHRHGDVLGRFTLRGQDQVYEDAGRPAGRDDAVLATAGRADTNFQRGATSGVTARDGY
ncbi:hypothetical protein [Plantactinospora sp. KLBMP9567]|uniref:hypothetical protein n=1 Tax=Plantactinospora sp. KLBMP9567 TaxID=3085900 RepID=UPI0029824B84|nr:hypothetical protein [Plantactinospora sp. KLBMP9567]MDW5323202.1 hypothetical protein [Plantactinospora sp. KLBMP9567]